MRSLAHIERIKDIYPIEGKDKIVLAQILGWTVIVQKDEFKVGDLCVYVEIDSVLPIEPRYEFLRSRCFIDNGVVSGFRIKSMKMAGVLSQGIVFPISDVLDEWDSHSFTEGEDVTDKLGIVLYQSKEDIEPVQQQPKTKTQKFWYKVKRLLRLKASRSWPEWIRQTDEPRVQNVPHMLKDTGTWYVTEKLEGQSGSFAKRYGKYYICSRTQVKQISGGNILEKFIAWLDNLILGSKYEGNNNWVKISEKYNLKEIPEGITVQGEIVGPGIQGNIYGLKELEFYVFNVQNNKTGEDFGLEWVEDFCNLFDLNFVPVLERAVVLNPDIDLNKFIASADGTSVLYPTLREGLVYRKHTEDGGKTSFKIRSNQYLLKHGE